jgi:hypothetical protein
MKNKFLFITILFSTVAWSQKGNNQMGLAFDICNPVGAYENYHPGIGAELKGLIGVGSSSGQLSLTTGIIQFNSSGNQFAKSRFIIVPIMLGYRHRIGKVYIEPELGGSQVQYKSGNHKSGQLKFTYAGGAGILIKKIDLGIRYQIADGLGLVIFRLGYSFTFGR